MQPHHTRTSRAPSISVPWPANWQKSLHRSWPFWAVALGLAALIALMVTRDSTLTIIAVLAVTVIAVAVTFRAQLPKLSISFLGICLLGYALLGKTFAYVGVAPLFIGEMALGLCLMAVLLRGRLSLLGRSPLLYLLGLNMAVGLTATLPFISEFGLDAVRDAVLWAYGLFAICVSVLLVQNGWLLTVVRQYIRFIPWFLGLATILLLLAKVPSLAALTLPGAGGVVLLYLKGGDVAVMLAMIASLLVLGVHRLPTLMMTSRAISARREWIWWLLWLGIFTLSLFRVRAGIIAVVAALLVLVLARAASRWRKPFIAVVLAVGLMAAFNIQIQLGEERNTVSVQSLLVNLQSITSTSGDADRDGSKGWRLRWWNDIVNYTLHGPYLWTGKGYGLNLADADGYQLGFATGESTLRSPHNAHMNILARSGLPGLLAWAALQLTFAVMLVLAYFRARSRGQELWARLNLWVLASWVAFMVNASFDVYLEGPQGGIWFWSFFGFGMALLEVQRRGLTGEQTGVAQNDSATIQLSKPSQRGAL